MMKRITLCMMILVLLLSALLLSGCGEKKYQALQGEKLEDCTLTLYYDDPNRWYRIPPTLQRVLENPDYYNETTVSGAELRENEQLLALLEMLEGEELPPVRLAVYYWEDIKPTIYYALTNKNGGKLFDVALDNRGEISLFGRPPVYFNGEEINFEKLSSFGVGRKQFYLCVEPYMTEPHYTYG